MRFNDETVRVIDAVAPKWEELAIALGFKPYTIQTIQRDHVQDARAACQRMLSMWLEEKEENLCRPATWLTLVQCLIDAEFSTLAQDLEDVLYF